MLCIFLMLDMKVRIVLLMLLVGWTRPTATQGPDYIRYPEDASVYIGAYVTVYNSGPNGCSPDKNSQSVQEFEAVRWIIDKINNEGFLPGHKIGIHAYKTCGLSEVALKNSVDMMNLYSNTSDSKILFGLLSPVKSSEAKVVSQFFSTLPEKDRMLMLSFGSTSSVLTSESAYRNYYRVIPPDKVQAKVMLQLMVQLKWNYVAVLYEYSDYGRDAANILNGSASEHQVCIPVFKSFDVNSRKTIFDAFVSDVLNLKVSGIVYIGSDLYVQPLFELFEQQIDVVDVEFIISESVRLSPVYFRRISNNYYESAVGSLVTSAPKIDIDEFSSHWASLKPSPNSWLSGQDSSLANHQSVYVNYAVKSVLILASLFQKVQQKTCSPSGEFICQSLRELPKQTYIDEIKRLELNLTQTFPFSSEMFKDTLAERIRFNADREINYEDEPSIPVYEVYEFKSGDCSNCQDCPFKQVGSYSNNSLRLDADFTANYPSSKSAQCATNTDCVSCLPSDLSDQVIYMEGDWYVVAVIPIFLQDDNNPLKCSGILRENFGYDIAEGVKNAIGELNSANSSDFLNGKRLGLIVLNGCGSELVIKDKLLRLHRGTYRIGPGLTSAEINKRILGYVGSLSSSMSTAMAEVLSKLGYVQVAFGSTSPLLSNRELYPYFLRIPTADDQQATVIVEIVKALKSNIIQVVHSEGSYGLGGYLALKSRADSSKICVISHTVPITEDYTKFNGLVANLRKTPQAKIVVTFIRTHLAEHVISAIIDRMSDGEFVLIGSETWGRRQNVLELANNRKLLGSLTIALELPPVDSLQEFQKEQKIDQPSDPWLRYFLEKKEKCIFPGSFLREGKSNGICPTKRPCHHSNTDTLCDQDPWLPFAAIATRALVRGVSNVITTPVCLDKTTTCSERNPEKIVEYMKKNVKLDLYNTGQLQRVFDDNGDGVVKYKILHVYESKPGVTSYEEIGSWSKTDHLKFNMEKLKLPTRYKSECLTQFVCDSCFPEESDTQQQNSTGDQDSNEWMIAVMVIFICVSVGLLAVIIFLVIKNRKKYVDDPYATPMDYMSTGQGGYITPTHVSDGMCDIGRHGDSMEHKTRPISYKRPTYDNGMSLDQPDTDGRTEGFDLPVVDDNQESYVPRPCKPVPSQTKQPERAGAIDNRQFPFENAKEKVDDQA